MSAESIRHSSLSFDIPFDRQQLADYLCINRAAMSTEISKLQKEDFIKTNRNHFELIACNETDLQDKQNVFVWDAPSHALSRPFTNNYSLSDMAEWLYEILAKEEIYNPIIIGQSMGGYLAQMYMELYPDKIKGFISIDSAPLQKSYMTAMEIWLLERAEPLYKIYPWKALLRAGSRGCAETDYGQNLMRKMMMSYNPDHKEYARLVADREKAKDILKRVNYYRFTGYALQFRQEPSGSDYIEKAEVYYRTQIVYGFSIAKCIEAPHD